MKTLKTIRNIIRWAIALVVLGGGALLFLAVEFPNHMTYLFDGGQHQRQVEQELKGPITPSVCYTADCRGIKSGNNSLNTSSDNTSNSDANDVNFKSIKKTVNGSKTTIIGRLVVGNGQGVPGDVVRADVGAYKVTDTTTDSDGNFSITVDNTYISPKGSAMVLVLSVDDNDGTSSWLTNDGVDKNGYNIGGLQIEIH